MGSVGSSTKKDVEKIIDWLDSESKGGGKSEPIDIDNIEDKTLQGIESRIRNLGHEELYVFNSNDELINGYKGDSKSVSFPSSLLDLQDATVTHGHPKGMEEFGGTFSFADINNMLKSNWLEHRATASGQGEMNYIMRRTSNSNAQGLRDAINREIPQLKKNISDTYYSVYKEELNNGSSKKHARHVARQRSVGILNAFYKRVMPQYGYTYTTRKKEYTYNR